MPSQPQVNLPDLNFDHFGMLRCVPLLLGPCIAHWLKMPKPQSDAPNDAQWLPEVRSRCSAELGEQTTAATTATAIVPSPAPLDWDVSSGRAATLILPVAASHCQALEASRN